MSERVTLQMTFRPSSVSVIYKSMWIIGITAAYIIFALHHDWERIFMICINQRCDEKHDALMFLRPSAVVGLGKLDFNHRLKDLPLKYRKHWWLIQDNHVAYILCNDADNSLQVARIPQDVSSNDIICKLDVIFRRVAELSVLVYIPHYFRTVGQYDGKQWRLRWKSVFNWFQKSSQVIPLILSTTVQRSPLSVYSGHCLVQDFSQSELPKV